MFYNRFFYFPASFYPFEVLNQSRIVNLLVLIDKNEVEGGKENKDDIMGVKPKIEPLHFKYRKVNDNVGG
jgi:hypothetical protein